MDSDPRITIKASTFIALIRIAQTVALKGVWADAAYNLAPRFADPPVLRRRRANRRRRLSRRRRGGRS